MPTVLEQGLQVQTHVQTVKHVSLPLQTYLSSSDLARQATIEHMLQNPANRLHDAVLVLNDFKLLRPVHLHHVAMRLISHLNLGSVCSDILDLLNSVEETLVGLKDAKLILEVGGLGHFYILEVFRV